MGPYLLFLATLASFNTFSFAFCSNSHSRDSRNLIGLHAIPHTTEGNQLQAGNVNKVAVTKGTRLL